MKKLYVIQRGLALMIIIMLMLPVGLQAQDLGAPDTAVRFSTEELTQMLAPIALYPDTLIAQILMASTYPLELVEAERWLRANKGLTGDALDNALQGKTWDPSIKSLCHYPDVLFAMSDKLDQTRKLGDAYLAQPDDVMAMVQELRRRANEQGTLKTTKEQNVVIEREIISIEPADPEVIYVPVYDPYYVYGSWWYPAYYPWYWYYPPGLGITGGYIWWGSPFFIGFGLFSWCWFDWHDRHIYVDYDRARNFHRRHDGDYGKYKWRHNPEHRRGVAYRDKRTSERFGQQPAQRRKIDSQMRGYPSREDSRQRTTAPGTRTDRERSRERIEQRGTITPGTTTDRERSRERIEQRGTTAPPSARTDRQRMQRTPRTETPFRGVGEGSFERKAGERGGQSLRSGGMRQPDVNIQQRQGGGGSMQPQRGGGSYRSAPQQQGGGGSRGGGQSGGSRGGGQSGGSRSGGQGGGSRR
jgi:hypothetical protein